MNNQAKPSSPGPLTAALSIESVLVYPAYASVTRRGHVRLPAGKHLVQLGTLPGSALPESIRLKVAGVDINLQDVITRPDAAAVSPTADPKAAPRFTGSALAQLHTQRDFLKHLAESAPTAFAQGLGQGQTSIQSVLEYLDFIAEQLQHTQVAIVEAEQPTRQAEMLTVLAKVQVSQAGDYCFELSYAVNQAGWVPTYIAQLDSATGSLQLLYLAEIFQDSGEDWPDVLLSLSSGQPEWLAAKALHLQPAAQMTHQEARSSSQVLEDAYRMLGAVPGSEIPPAAQWTQPIAAETQAVIEMPVTGRYSFFSGHTQTVEVTQYTQVAQLQKVAYPRQFTHPQLQAEVRLGMEAMALLPGTIKLFCDRTYQGTTRLPQLFHQKTVQLNFGTVDQVTLQHIPLGPQGEQTWGQRILLHNHDDAEQHCTLIDRLPGSLEGAQVQIVQSTPAAITTDGEYRWDMVLSPHSSATIEYHYRISKRGHLSRFE